MPITANSKLMASALRLPISRATLLLAIALPLAACGPDRIVTNSVPSQDYRAVHPIVLGQQPQTLDIFIAGAQGGLDSRSAAQVREFASKYKVSGQGPITVLTPTGAGNQAASHHAMAAIRKALVAGGAHGFINVGNYPVSDPTLAAPIRLTFSGLAARVASKCGQWPTDLASGSSFEGGSNKTYWNFGCATQNTLAAQIADPRDLVTPAASTPADSEMRMRAIGAVRKGSDPSTTWIVKNTSIGSVGGN